MPIGALSSLRPIVLLTTLRKVLSLVVLARISSNVNSYLSAGQSDFRHGRSTADIVFGYHWMAAKSQKYQEAMEIRIDMNRAFDTIRHDSLMHILETFLDDSELRMIRLLLADTTLEPRLAKRSCATFSTTIGTPQGDSLSPVLFIVYLEAAVRDLRLMLPPHPQTDIDLPLDIAYADDVHFVSHSHAFLNLVESIAPTCLRRGADRVAEVWRVTKKLGSLLGDAEDVARRNSWLCWHSTGCGHCGCDDYMLVKHCAFNITMHSLYLFSLTTWALGF